MGKTASDTAHSIPIKEVSYEIFLKTLLALWLKGTAVDFSPIYPDGSFLKKPLPVYPFEEEKHWIQKKEKERVIKLPGLNTMDTTAEFNPPPATQKLSHPMIGKIVSTMPSVSCMTQFSGNEFYLSDHIVDGNLVLPGVAYLEMARAAGELAEERNIRHIYNLIWAHPIIVDKTSPPKIYITLKQEHNTTGFEIYTRDENNEKSICSQGKLGRDINNIPGNTFDIEAIRSRCTYKKDGVECYTLFKNRGIQYGSGFRVIEELYYSEDEALSFLSLPPHLSHGFTDYILHPSIMDGALQTVAGMDRENSGELFLPFSLGDLKFIRPIEKKCFIYVKLSKHNPLTLFDIYLTDTSGNSLVEFKNFSMRRAARQKTTATDPETLYCRFVWEKKEEQLPDKSVPPPSSVILFDRDEDLFREIQKKYEKPVLIKPANGFKETSENGETNRIIYGIDPHNSQHYQMLITSLNNRNIMPDTIIWFWTKEVSTKNATDQNLWHSIYPLLHLTQALMRVNPNSIRLLYICNNSPFHKAFSGFIKTVRLENPDFNYSLIGFNDLTEKALISEKITAELRTNDMPSDIRYMDGQREVMGLKEIDMTGEPLNELPLKQHGTYLITGGMGGLGLIFAEYLAEYWNANIILTGRSDLDTGKKTKIAGLDRYEGKVIYQKNDTASYAETVRLIDSIKKQFGEINGIIHSAGILKDAFVINKTVQTLGDVFAPKIHSVINLDKATEKDRLDFLALFSSISGAIGNIGQCDYAYANCFLNAFAEERQILVSKGRRSGRTVSISWPLWKNGGMTVDERTESILKKKYGIRPLPTDEGVKIFMDALKMNRQLIIAHGDKAKIRGYLGVEDDEKIEPVSEYPTNEVEIDIHQELLGLLSALLGVGKEDLDPDTQMDEYGIDSILMMDTINRLEEMFGCTLSPTAIIDYPTINLLAEYLKSNTVVTGYDAGEINPNRQEEHIPTQVIEKKNDPKEPENTPVSTPQKVAVISMSCRFPGAQRIEKFWDNLITGTGSITETPSSRWDISKHFSSDKSESQKTYSKWGGYIEGVDLFDAAYFGISDSDAQVIDPQHRILLELTQELIDRAGYKREELKRKNIGVFLGMSESSYIRLNYRHITDEQMKHVIVNRIQNMAAARISDFYDIVGPSKTIDTACSSSLVAIHEACKAIQSNECSMAIAGGIELLIDPLTHIEFSKAGVLSDENRSYVFDERAKGFVLGEGAGLVFLKPYKKAVDDRDNILGAVSGSAVNNDGRTMGLTVPSLDGQKDVIKKAIENSQADPSDITFLETHGTGTLLGDPIEIKAITEVYRKYSRDRQYCAVGSVKSNIGHLLHAAGVAGFIKTILALYHKKIPSTVHCETPHPRFEFENSPFYPITHAKEWNTENGLRSAAISSFGFGGTNCHMIVEEHPGSDEVVDRTPLPLTPFNRKRYWLGKTIDPAPVHHGRDRVKAGPTGPDKDILKNRVEAFLTDKILWLLQVTKADLDFEANFMELGIDSVSLINLTGEIEEELDIELYPTLFFEYPNIKKISGYLADEYSDNLSNFFKTEPIITTHSPAPDIPPKTPEFGCKTDRNDIAIIGMSGVFPDSPGIESFWENLKKGRDLTREIPPDRFNYKPFFDHDAGAADNIYCKWGGFINDVDQFDAHFFNVSPREAELMDPQLRILLEVMYQTAEDACLASTIKGTKTGVYTGICFQDYHQEVQERITQVDPYGGMGNAATMMANRPSFYFDLKGPSIVINTACSSSLVATHLACQALRNNECEMAFVSGTNLILSAWHYRYLCSINALSHTGKCHTFDKRADGYVPGEAVAAILLKPLEHAVSENNK